MPSSEKINSSPKYLLVDDEFATNKEAQEVFLQKVGLSVEDGIFAYDYQEALSQIKLTSNIVVCFIDLIIPKSPEKYDYEQGDLIAENWWGLKLVSQIKKNKDIRIVIYSAQVPKDYLKEESEKYEDVTYCRKEINTEDLLRIRKLELERIFKLNNVSKSSAIKKNFDYSTLDEETYSFISSRAIEIKKLVKRTTEDIFNIGNNLIAVKEKLGRGNFQQWISTEFGWTERTAQRFMLVAKNLKPDSLSGLKFLPSALYVLSAPSTPETAREEALERARTGEVITEKLAIGIRAEHISLHKEIDDKLRDPEFVKRIKQVKQVDLDENKEPKITQLEIETEEKKVAEVHEKVEQTKEKIEQPKQTILGIQPREKPTKNTWWQLGEEHQLFCGEPKSDEFLSKLPPNVALVVNCPPNNDFSKIPPVKSGLEISFRSKYFDVDVDSLANGLEKFLTNTTKSQDTVVFCYLFDLKLLEKTTEMDRSCFVAEPNLDKCDRIITHWRQKESVKRIVT